MIFCSLRFRIRSTVINTRPDILEKEIYVLSVPCCSDIDLSDLSTIGKQQQQLFLPLLHVFQEGTAEEGVAVWGGGNDPSRYYNVVSLASKFKYFCGKRLVPLYFNRR